ELIPAWAGEDVALLPLQRLMRADVEEMAKAALGVQSPLPPTLVEQVVQRAEGVPLFVEKLTRVVVESARRADGELDLAFAPWGLEIPSGLRDLLTARLDRVSASARETAQLAAVLGREFSYDVLHAVSSKDEVFLREDVEELGRAGLVLQRRSARK